MYYDLFNVFEFGITSPLYSPCPFCVPAYWLLSKIMLSCRMCHLLDLSDCFLVVSFNLRHPPTPWPPSHLSVRSKGPIRSGYSVFHRTLAGWQAACGCVVGSTCSWWVSGVGTDTLALPALCTRRHWTLWWLHRVGHLYLGKGRRLLQMQFSMVTTDPDNILH